MFIDKNSYAKINITLRVTGIRSDGYHNIYSFFTRINAAEKLQIGLSSRNHDIVESENILIKGENIIAKALRIARDCGNDIPFLDISLYKTIPPGMGLGGGSGNAGTILDFVGAKLPFNVISKIGADVPFFYKNCEAAIVSGIGDKVEPVLKLPISIAVIIPKWHSITGNAYSLLDMYWLARGGYPLDERRAKYELEMIYSHLASNKFLGLLPNDFAPMLIEENAIYDEYFQIFKELGAIAWGITGSGSSVFVLFSDRSFCPSLLDRMQNYNEFVDKVIMP